MFEKAKKIMYKIKSSAYGLNRPYALFIPEIFLTFLCPHSERAGKNAPAAYHRIPRETPYKHFRKNVPP